MIFTTKNFLEQSVYISLSIKVKLYKLLVMETMLYSGKLWPLTVKHMKTLEAAHHEFQRRLFEIKWYDRVSNVDVRKRTGMAELEEIIKERRLRWLRHVIRIEDCRIPRYDTIRDAILTCARKPTKVSLIYRTEPTTKKV